MMLDPTEIAYLALDLVITTMLYMVGYAVLGFAGLMITVCAGIWIVKRFLKWSERP